MYFISIWKGLSSQLLPIVGSIFVLYKHKFRSTFNRYILHVDLIATLIVIQLDYPTKLLSKPSFKDSYKTNIKITLKVEVKQIVDYFFYFFFWSNL
jgi:hypothetical protein